MKSIKIYAFEDSCAECRKKDGAIINMDEVELGRNAPPFPDCLNTDKGTRLGCQCYWRPNDLSID